LPLTHRGGLHGLAILDGTDFCAGSGALRGLLRHEQRPSPHPHREQAGQVLGVGRSTAYELVRSGDLKCIRLRRRIVVPVAHLAESLGVDRDSVWATLTDAAVEPAGPPAVEQSGNRRSRRGSASMTETPTLF
jgi:hypothetical protein